MQIIKRATPPVLQHQVMFSLIAFPCEEKQRFFSLSSRERWVMTAKCRRDGMDMLSVKIVNAGWYNVTVDPMDCKEEGGNGCPALVLTETTNVRLFHELNDVTR